MPRPKFKEGNKIGNRFTSENQPENKGRKPSRYKQILAQLEAVGEPISNDDLTKIISHLLTMTPTELQNILKNKDTPLAITVIGSSIAGDVENKQLNNLEKLIDRIFGKVSTPIEHRDATSLEMERMTDEELKQYISANAEGSTD